MKIKYIIITVVLFFVGRYFWLKNKSKKTDTKAKPNNNGGGGGGSSSYISPFESSRTEPQEKVTANSTIFPNTLQEETPTTSGTGFHEDEKKEEVITYPTKPYETANDEVMYEKPKQGTTFFEKDPNCGILYKCKK